MPEDRRPGALLGAEHGAPLRSWSDEARERLALGVAESWLAWCDGWGVASTAPVTCEEPRADDEPRAWSPVGSVAGGAWWSLTPARPDCGARDPSARAASALVEALFGARASSAGVLAAPGHEPRPTMAEEVARAAWDDLLERIVRALGGAAGSDKGASSAQELVEDALRAWSGAAVVQLSLAPARFRLLLSYGVAARLLGDAPRAASGAGDARSGGLAPVLGVLEARRVRTRAQLSSIELPLGALIDLRVGDILCSDHALAVPLHLHVVDGVTCGERVAHGFVGKVGAVRGVELLAPDALQEDAAPRR